MRAAILTISTSVAHRQAEDRSGSRLAALTEQAGIEVGAMEVLADDAALIEDRINNWADEGFELILTTGGTGLSPDDVTPEAVRAALDREIPGIAEALRAESLRHTPHGMLSREVAGVVGRSLVVSLPGNPKAIDQLFGVLAPVVEHAVSIIRREGGRGGGH